jgi:hypothetical protein
MAGFIPAMFFVGDVKTDSKISACGFKSQRKFG